MALTEQDINLQKFLLNFTYTNDAAPNGRIVLANSDFIICAALLKLDRTLMRRKE